MRQTRPAPLLSISNTSEYFTNYSQRIGKRIWCVVQKNDMNVSWHGTTKGLSLNQANKCYQNLIFSLIPLQYFHTKIGGTSSFALSHFLVKYVEETSSATGTGRGCQDIKTSLNTMLLRTGFVDSCQSFFFGFLDITSDIQLEQKTKLQLL